MIHPSLYIPRVEGLLCEVTAGVEQFVGVVCDSEVIGRDHAHCSQCIAIAHVAMPREEIGLEVVSARNTAEIVHGALCRKIQ